MRNCVFINKNNLFYMIYSIVPYQRTCSSHRCSLPSGAVSGTSHVKLFKDMEPVIADLTLHSKAPTQPLSKALALDSNTHTGTSVSDESVTPHSSERDIGSGCHISDRTEMCDDRLRNNSTSCSFERVDKQVQTFISGDFFVNTANIYSGHLVE